MRVQCDVCEKNKAAVMCCADEAALCTSCDTRVHAANKLANKHVRVPLVGQLESPKCDICQVSILRCSSTEIRGIDVFLVYAASEYAVCTL